ncbi:helix-turn-helix domain-containing protein [Streptomyces sp. NPDC048606]|uniref:helix-turn-helix domain-containing protein n=1 Tax=Streptomyces sp. NPDC048606 TaxID=3154726 RepID=UPI00343C01EF
MNRTPRPIRRRSPAAPPPPPAAAHTGPDVGSEPTVPAQLARNVARTYALLTGGEPRTVPELAEAIGYTPRTITRHLKDLSSQGLVAASDEGRWAANGTPVRRITVG